MAHKQSIRFSLSKMPAFTIRQSWTIPFFIKSYFGKGVPLQRFDIVHAICLIRFLSLVWVLIFINCYKAPDCIILSLYLTQSPDKLPIAQMAWSTTPGMFYIKSWTNIGIPPLSITDSHCWVEPEHTLVRIHVAYNCNCGNTFCLHI